MFAQVLDPIAKSRVQSYTRVLSGDDFAKTICPEWSFVMFYTRKEDQSVIGAKVLVFADAQWYT